MRKYPEKNLFAILRPNESRPYWHMYCKQKITKSITEKISRKELAPVRATEEKEFLAFGNRIIGLANDLTKKCIACKLSVAYGNFTFNMDTTRLAKSPRRRRKKYPSVLKCDK